MKGTPCSARATRTSGGIFATIAVPSQGGYSSESAGTRVSAASSADNAALAAAYEAWAALPNRPAQLEMPTTRRSGSCRVTPSATCSPVTFGASTRSTEASSVSATGASSVTPAACTRTVNPPNLLRASSSALPGSFVTSHCANVKDASAGGARPATTTFAPLRASACAILSPTPRVPPVTSTTSFAPIWIGSPDGAGCRSVS
ncbi:MAG: hypothetical protein E6J88_03195 [Deltaproteobacteria bacterium]|nr:MAG: hypothetical protein E6J88_03195 [Deltaproteobacteria bacterium]